jgi:hypothetical protein
MKYKFLALALCIFGKTLLFAQSNSSTAKPSTTNTKTIKKGSELMWDVHDDGFSGFFTVVFTAVTADSICFKWHVAEITEPIQKGTVKIGKNAIGSATKFESEFLQENDKRFTTLQNGVIFFLSNSVANQLIANQPADIQFLPDAKSKCKLIKENKFRLSPEDAKTFIIQYECEHETAAPFSFINNYNIPIVTGISVKTATFSLMSIKL